VIQRGPAPDLINAVAAPVRDARGSIVAAVNLAAAAQYLDQERMRALASVVIETAHAISANLGAQEQPVARSRR
jgi:DNA-binding IclR family transcriptional regulator